jgi:hypothetical protein
MGRSPSVAPKVNIGETLNITFGATTRHLPISQPMKIEINESTRSFTIRKTTLLIVALRHKL